MDRRGMTPCFGLAFGLGSLGLASFGPARFLSRRLAAGAAALAAIALPLVLVGGPAGAQNAAVQAPAATPQQSRIGPSNESRPDRGPDRRGPER